MFASREKSDLLIEYYFHQYLYNSLLRRSDVKSEVPEDTQDPGVLLQNQMRFKVKVTVRHNSIKARRFQ